MDPNQLLIRQFLQIVENQLRDNDPVQTAQTLARLKKEGYPDKEARQLIAQCVAAEMFKVIQTEQPFNMERYIGCLNHLPNSPEEG